MEAFEEQLHKAIERGDVVNAVLEVRRTGVYSTPDCPSSISDLRIVDHNYKYEKALGKLTTDPSSPDIKPDVVFWVASCTKLLTSIAAMQCVARGQLLLDVPVSQILPELAEPDILEGFDTTSQRPLLHRAAKPITLLQLLTHTSGLLGYPFSSPLLAQWRKLYPIADPKRDVVKEFLLPLTFVPGEPGHWQYSVGLDWVGKMIERVNGGMKLGEYMKKYIFDPLHMTDTTFRPLQRKDLMDRMCPRVARQEDGSLKMDSMEQFPVIEPVDDAGGGGIYTTAADYVKVLESLLRNDGKILDPLSVDCLFQPELSIKEDLANQYDSIAANQRLQKSLNQTGAGSVLNGWAWDGDVLKGQQVNLNHSLGGLVAVDGVPGTAGRGLLCWYGLPNCFWWIDRQRGTCGFYGSQIFPHGDRKTAELFGEFRKAAYKDAV